MPAVDAAEVEVIAPNFKRRLSGVTSTIIQLVPLQARFGLSIATLGPGLPDHLARLRYRDVWKLWARPKSGKHRVWHARRNVEMVAGLIGRDVLRMPLRLVFTSASQRAHKPFTRFLIARMDAVIATSRKTAGYLAVPSTVIMHGIDLERFTPPASRKAAKAAVGLDPAKRHLGCFGRIRHQKGTDVFLEAAIALLAANPDWDAVIAGRATAEHAAFESQLKRRAAEAGLDARIHFVGEHRDIERWYQALDLYVAPQRWEGFGLTPLEAMACAVPVIATDVGAFSELVVEGETGCVVQTSQPRLIVDTASRLMKDDGMLKRMGGAARAHVEAHFALASEVRALMQVYREVAERP
ncbi:MAG: glycosyltransferase family 4 protein [Rhizobiaceae bacterium]|nr:glycosyltransferase family 4 protein [Rhizobiaceae bacterium]